MACYESPLRDPSMRLTAVPKASFIALSVVVLVLLAGCGHKGPLYQPPASTISDDAQQK